MNNNKVVVKKAPEGKKKLPALKNLSRNVRPKRF